MDLDFYVRVRAYGKRVSWNHLVSFTDWLPIPKFRQDQYYYKCKIKDFWKGKLIT